ncbi:MAG TPA: ABC transporter ATP-binding protein [Hydrogenophaga sp.]
MSLLIGTQIVKRFGSLTVLHGVDIAIQRGEALGVVGPNGAGKTTLFGVLAGVLPATQGQVLFDGSDITSMPAEMRCRQGIARTHQVPRPFLGMTVLENTLVAAQQGALLRGSRAVEAAQAALDRVGMGALADRPAATLGLLDRKRLELARTLATGPSVLLLDEIGGGLTEGELLQLVALIDRLRTSGLTIVWIEHVLHALLRVVDRLICMDAGAILAEGSPDAVMADPRVMSAYLGGIPA